MGVGAGNRQSDIPARGRGLHDPRVGGLVGAAWGGVGAFVDGGWLRIAAFFIVLLGLVFVVKLLSSFAN